MNPLRMALFALLACALVQRAGASVLVDDAGRRVAFERPVQRVITLAPNLTEFVYAVGAGATLVGTVDTSDYPVPATQVPRIGDYQRLDVERILGLKPDVILVWYHGNQGRELEQLQAAGLRLFYLEPRRLDDVARTLERVGTLLGRDQAGRESAAHFRAQVEILRSRYAGAPPVTVFFQVWAQPLMTLNDQHLTSDLLALCGGRNVFGGLSALAPQISVESVVAANPQAIFTASESHGDAPRWRRDPQRPAFERWQRFGDMQAVRHGWLFSVPGDLVTRQGPRAIEGAQAVCAALDQVRAERGAGRTGS
ncbi:MAG TPA: cobalamin-binding protein [Albitalea sp.]|nr:cobalamin-binding protein [Albitalea sp.]